MGFWKSPTEAAYISPADTSQNQRIRDCLLEPAAGWPSATFFLRMANISFPLQNFGLGKFIPSEKLAFLIDNEVVDIRDYRGVGLIGRQLIR